MGRAEERRARQRGGHRAAPKRSSRAGPSRRAAYAASSPGRRSSVRSSGSACSAWRAFVALYLLVDVPKGNAQAAAAEQHLQVQRRQGPRPRPARSTARSSTWTRSPRASSMTFVAAENKSFYKDSGVDFKGTARGLLNTLAGKGKQGGSTITQQYVKNYYLTQDQTVTRKLKELVISLKVDQQVRPRTTSSRATSTPATTAAARTASRPPPRPTTASTRTSSTSRRAPTSPRCSRRRASTTGRSPTDTGKKLVTDRWNYVLDNMVERAGSTRPSARRHDVPRAERRPRPRPVWRARPATWSRRRHAEKQLVARGRQRRGRDDRRPAAGPSP